MAQLQQKELLGDQHSSYLAYYQSSQQNLSTSGIKDQKQDQAGQILLDTFKSQIKQDQASQILLDTSKPQIKQDQAGQILLDTFQPQKESSISYFVFLPDSIEQTKNEYPQKSEPKPSTSQNIINQAQRSQLNETLQLKQMLQFMEQIIVQTKNQKYLQIPLVPPRIFDFFEAHQEKSQEKTKKKPFIQDFRSGKTHQKYMLENLQLNGPKHKKFTPQKLGYNGQYQRTPSRQDFMNPLHYRSIATKTGYEINRPKIRHDQFASQNFVFKNVLVSIKLCSFMNLRRGILLVPFSSSDFKDVITKTIVQHLRYNLKQIVCRQTQKSNQRQLTHGYCFSVRARGLQHNYPAIYFLKSPQKQNGNLKYYDQDRLKVGMSNIFKLLDLHHESSIIIPDFEWGCLEKRQSSHILISSVFREISQNKRSYKCSPLREMVISVSNCENFDIYCKVFKDYTGQLR